MSLYLGNDLIAPNQSNAANKSLSNLDATGQAVIDSKADVDLKNCTKPHIVETYQNGTSWYRVYSDGWCEQGSYYDVGSVSSATISLLKSFVNTNYSVMLTNLYGTVGNKHAIHVLSLSTNSFSYYSENENGNVYWQACGYIR